MDHIYIYFTIEETEKYIALIYNSCGTPFAIFIIIQGNLKDVSKRIQGARGTFPVPVSAYEV